MRVLAGSGLVLCSRPLLRAHVICILRLKTTTSFAFFFQLDPDIFYDVFEEKLLRPQLCSFGLTREKKGEKILMFLTKKSKVFQWFQTVYINEKRNTNCRVMYTLSTRCFWATDANRKAVFLFNLSSHCHIYIVKYLFLIGKFGDTTVLACEMFTSGIPSVAQKPILLKLSLKVMLLLVLR